MPLLLAPPPPGWEFFVRVPEAPLPASCTSALTSSENSWPYPVKLLKPLAPMFTGENVVGTGNFLAGLRAESLLGAQLLPARDQGLAPLAWVGVTLQPSVRGLFADVRGGCWVRGVPEVGRGRELLRAAGLADRKGMEVMMAELKLPKSLSSDNFFNFQFNHGATDCDRVYVLDTANRRLHGFATPPSPLAPDWVK